MQQKEKEKISQKAADWARKNKLQTNKNNVLA